jgi:hypothetical protein
MYSIDNSNLTPDSDPVDSGPLVNDGKSGDPN